MINPKAPVVSLVIPAKNEGRNVKNTIKSALKVKTSFPFEIIVVDDGSTDKCCDFISSLGINQIKRIQTNGVGAAQARNIGANAAKGTYLIFCDAHLFFEDDWIEGLLEPIQQGIADAVTPGIANVDSPQYPGLGQTLNASLETQWHLNKSELFPTAILPGGCLAISKEVFADIGGFDRYFKVWGYEDIELSIKMWLFGYTCFVQPAVKILHVFRSVHPYNINWDDFYFNMLRMAYSHFSEDRINKCKAAITNSNPEAIESEVLNTNVLAQREQYFQRRKYDDDWFMKKFEIPF
ncbi:glycosyltransferase [Bacillus sp. BRMEA1]|uniref:glycosyltransferase family 2 protein n=1 Tax=Neobacillus endophyticus TaxID=2738405 RepID=UPI001565E20D|nr:glycosyltransferase [Neobacillus endophyticus]NRD76724.1 glycosyltransferase [Neobacillus endophyticus]